MANELKIKYRELPMNSFVSAYVTANYPSAEDHDWFYDPARQVVVLKLYERDVVPVPSTCRHCGAGASSHEPMLGTCQDLKGVFDAVAPSEERGQ